MSLGCAEATTIVMEVDNRCIQLVQTPLDIYFTFSKADEITAEIDCKDAPQAIEIWNTLLNPPSEPRYFEMKRDAFAISKFGEDQVQLVYYIGKSNDESRTYHFPISAVKNPCA